ncbi:hypothetical protein [Saprospira grandis]|uniref:Uncharacterized protein n=1 Tax=Saprospira grandis (strain Lewin) TaxID=984262 RepID=H6L0K6_SAPGL|nr:hypothetical protein [Saprospira grandis]AFC24542.1 hypothetical protein SGRA_1807 [Saprospira grandis str. Lewin]
MYKLFFVFTFLALNLGMNAQNVIENLKKNPNISWHQTAVISFHTELGQAAKAIQLSKDSRKNVVIKHQMPRRLDRRFQDFGYHKFASKMMTEAFWGQAQNKCYADPQLSQLISVEELNKKLAVIDTMIIFDQETGEEIVHVHQTTKGANHISHFKLFVCYAYNSKTENFEVYPISIAPVDGSFNSLGELISEEEMFWIPVNLQQKINPNQKNLEWIQWQEMGCYFKDTEGLAKVGMRQLANLPAKVKARQAKTEAAMRYGEAISPERLKLLQKLKAKDIQGLYFSYLLAWDKKKEQLIMEIEGHAPLAHNGPIYFIQK